MIDTLDIKITQTATSRIDEVDFSNLSFGKTFSDHMFVADYEDGEWKNFQIVPYGDMSFSPAMSVLHYGQAFFEGLKAYKHADGSVALFRPYKNADRFNRSAVRLCSPELPRDIFVQSIAALVDLDKAWIPKSAGDSLYIRPFMFSTDPYLGVSPSKTYKFIVLTCPVGSYFSKPLNVKIETKYSRSSEGGFGFAKAAGNYAGSLLPAQEALKEGYDQLIWTDGKDHAYIEELGAANVIFVIDGVLVTPSTRDTILEGITRDTILTLARNWDMPVEERRVSVKEVIETLKEGKMTEAFGVGTAATITPIASISLNGEKYNLPEQGPADFSKKALKTLNEIRYGHTADKFDWNYTV
ncbi:Branched-chain amino acid aminotransferase [Arcticibacter svalbardensis MN12-7]|uniref:branched-chain-amino-acid transaminase n=1 Tax=Arcticibacter svalbardensis MN12-7 TaxID=1150600 RepID=R9GUU8_9SPHI|nr:branched-chain amino acid aminotransferase [Arcticibacter svalbardensis]EOR95295.1 Branched-chain amino acid aminotransferase [Arcticibacter svalbardensis MN12-7]